MMRSTYGLLFTLLLVAVLAQDTSVPPELSSGFQPDEITLTVGYNGNGLDSFTDGSTLSTSEVADAPLFGLGDSSGINTEIEFMIAMVDSTNPDDLQLHFLQTNFAADGFETGIASHTTPTVSYHAPSSFGETGRRQYSFLLFIQQIQGTVLEVPDLGQPFDISLFETANDLQSAIAGIAMFVDLETSNASASSSSTAQAASSATPTSSPTSASTIVPAASASTTTTSPAAGASAAATSPTTTATTRSTSLAGFPSKSTSTTTTDHTKSSTTAKGSSSHITTSTTSATGTATTGTGSTSISFILSGTGTATATAGATSGAMGRGGAPAVLYGLVGVAIGALVQVVF